MSSSLWGPSWPQDPSSEPGPSPIVVAALDRLPRGRALDLGAGEGRHSLWLAGKGWHVTALDQAAVAIGRLQAQAALQGLDIVAEVTDVTHWTPRHRGYDLVLLAYLELPLASLKRALRTGAAALADAGELFVVAHDVSNVANGYGGPPDPDVLTTAAVVADVLVEAGLDILRAEVVTRQVITDAGLRFALDHVVHAVQPGAR